MKPLFWIVLLLGVGCGIKAPTPSETAPVSTHVRVLWSESIDAGTAASKIDVDGSCYVLIIRHNALAAVDASCEP